MVDSRSGGLSRLPRPFLFRHSRRGAGGAPSHSLDGTGAAVEPLRGAVRRAAPARLLRLAPLPCHPRSFSFHNPTTDRVHGEVRRRAAA